MSFREGNPPSPPPQNEPLKNPPRLGLNAKNLWEFIFMASRRMTFSYFPKVALDHGGGGCPPIPLRNHCFG